MQRIVNLKTDHYVIWCTSLDAPITTVMTYDQMILYINNWEDDKDFFKSMKKKQFLELLANAKKWGVSTQLVHSENNLDNVLELISDNRAGDGDEPLSLDELIIKYSR